MPTSDFVPQGGTSPGKQKKIETVANLTEKLAKAKSVVFADYRGLKHKQLEDVRKVLKKLQSELVIVKNRLLLRSLGEKSKGAESSLNEPTAALFSYEDEVAPIKELLKYFKTSGAGKAKGGFLGTTALTQSEVERLAALPARKELLSQLAGQLQAPLSGLHYALSWNINKLVWGLNAVKEQKGAN